MLIAEPQTTVECVTEERTSDDSNNTALSMPSSADDHDSDMQQILQQLCFGGNDESESDENFSLRYDSDSESEHSNRKSTSIEPRSNGEQLLPVQKVNSWHSEINIEHAYARLPEFVVTKAGVVPKPKIIISRRNTLPAKVMTAPIINMYKGKHGQMPIIKSVMSIAHVNGSKNGQTTIDQAQSVANEVNRTQISMDHYNYMGGPFHCTCLKRFVCFNSFESHKRKKLCVDNNVSRTVICGSCLKMFHDTNALRTHGCMNTHLNCTPIFIYKCKCCSAEFGTRLQLKTHCEQNKHRGVLSIEKARQPKDQETPKLPANLKRLIPMPVSQSDTTELKRAYTVKRIAPAGSAVEQPEPKIRVKDLSELSQPNKTSSKESASVSTLQVNGPNVIVEREERNLFKVRLADVRKLTDDTVDPGVLACTECDKVFPSRARLDAHWSVHVHDSIQADKISNRPRVLVSLKGGKKAVRYMCTRCGLSFPSHDMFQLHLRDHTRVRCTQCKSFFNNLLVLKNHIRIVHAQGSNESSSGTNEPIVID